MIRIAQAGADEKYQYRFGEAGDQRKGTPDANGCFDGELNVQPWYNKPWDCVIRPKDPMTADTIATAAHMICLNKNVGYDQNQDETLWEAFEKTLGWNIAAIPHLPLCETDCCRLWDTCARLAGVNMPGQKHLWTGTVRKACEASGLFEIYHDESYTQHTTHLKRGDMLLQEGHHVAIVLDSAEAEIGTPYRIWNCVACCLRSAGNTGGKILKYLHPGDIVTLHGWTPSGWGNVTFEGIKGYVSPKYLKPAKQVKTTGKVWLRAGAGTNTTGLTVIPYGTTIPWNGNTAKNGSTTWYQLTYGGYTGYSSGLYIKVL